MGVRSKALAACAALAAVASLAGASAAGAATDWTQLRTLNIAHQGGENEAPSNTMYAYERALRLGADMLEVDIHTTADGEVVVMHDATVNRTTEGTGRVYDMTLEQVQALDAAYDFVPGRNTQAGRPDNEYAYRGVRTGDRDPPGKFEPDDFRIPTLDEVLDAFPGVPINIEIKGAADVDVLSFMRNAEALAAVLNRRRRTDGVIVASFNDIALQYFHLLAPRIKLAPGIVGVAAFKATSLATPGTAAFQVPIDYQGIPITDRNLVTRAHRGGYGVHVWTINDPATMRQLLDWGVDGIMTAEPTRLEQVLCDDGVPRPDLEFETNRCNHERASISCTVTPAGRALLRGGQVRVQLVRSDEFPGRCAGRARLRVRLRGTRGAPKVVRSRAGFELGDVPPSEGGQARTRVSLPLRRRDLRALERARGAPRAKVTARPYAAFARRTSLPLAR